MIYPERIKMEFPVLLNIDVPEIYAYSIYSVIAEKFEAIVSLGTVNSRYKDFYDIYMLTNRYSIDAIELKDAVQETFEHRGTDFDDIVAFTDAFEKDEIHQRRWEAFIKKKKALEKVAFTDVLIRIRNLLVPIVASIQNKVIFAAAWNCNKKCWDCFKVNCNMKKIKELSDATLLGMDGWSNARPRLTARAILKNQEGLYALMYAEKYGLYSLPGGGVEENESITDALKRELLEETGCSSDEIKELGYVYENRAHCDYTQYSYYYTVLSKTMPKTNRLTEAEEANGTKLLWVSFEKLVALISEFQPKTRQQIYLQARDLAALEAYKNDCADTY